MSQDQIYIDASNVYSSLQDYNSAYTKYLMCSENKPMIDPTTGAIVRDPNSQKMVYSNASCSKPDPNQLIQQIQSLQNSIVTIINTNKSSDSSMNITTQSYNDVIKLRNELDQKLQELYNTNQSVPMMYQQNADSMQYAVILWAILASSLLYYLVTKKNL
jgi:hypothetical protein